MIGGGLRKTIGLLVCEPEPRWAPALKALLARQPDQSATYRVVTKQDRPTQADLAECPGPALLFAEAKTSGFDQFLNWLLAARRFDAVLVVALLGRGFDDRPADQIALAESTLREAGAAAVLRSTAELARAITLAERHAQRHAKLRDAIDSPRESIWQRLPWQPPAGPLR